MVIWVLPPRNLRSAAVVGNDAKDKLTAARADNSLETVTADNRKTIIRVNRD
jgi:hypothetical protein